MQDLPHQNSPDIIPLQVDRPNEVNRPGQRNGTIFLLDAIQDAAFIIDPFTKKILYANDNAASVYGLQKNELIGCSATILWIDKTRESAMITSVLSEGRINNFESLHKTASGASINININARLIEFESSKAVLTINRDITELVLNEAGVKIAKVEWRDTVDAVSDMIILEDADGMLRRCNQAAKAYFNKEYDVLVGSHLAGLLSRTDSENEQHLRQTFWEGKLAGGENWFEINNHRIDSSIDSKYRWVHVIKDITSRRESKKELLKLYSVIEQSSDGTVIIDLNGIIEYVNEEFERSVGSERIDLIGRALYEIKPELDSGRLQSEVFRHLETYNFWRVTNVIAKRPDNIFEEVTASKVVDADGNLINYVLAFRDVTETRQLESIAEAVNTMQNVGYVFSGIRHELGNPVNSVKMALTVMEKNYNKWDEQQVYTYITRCQQELSRVEYLLRTLKNFSLHEHPKIEKVPLQNFLEQFVSFIRADFIKLGISISLHSLLDEESADCDPRALHQVLMNLMANAADALAQTENAKITILLSKGRNGLRLTVSDNGAGMSRKQLTNLFKPFYTSKPDGSGLGLVIVRKMLVNMGGTIEVESELGRGTHIHITLRESKEAN